MRSGEEVWRSLLYFPKIKLGFERNIRGGKVYHIGIRFLSIAVPLQTLITESYR